MWVLNAIAPKHALNKNDIGKKLGEFYDSRKAQFQDNSELWKQKAVARLQQQALVQFKRSLTQNLIPMVSKEPG
ncbi:MAG: hypothetical protein QNJ47_06785 [Nostocaceae cyanobacterium]|nr:hypothetical protein [Nostocaceae cyanobacterium]